MAGPPAALKHACTRARVHVCPRSSLLGKEPGADGRHGAGPNDIFQNHHMPTLTESQTGTSGPQGSLRPATLQTGSLRPRERDNPKATQHIQGRRLNASQAVRTKLVTSCSHVAPPGVFPSKYPWGQSARDRKGPHPKAQSSDRGAPAPATGELLGDEGAFWHTACHTLRGQLSRVGPSLSSPL